jgi:hypothetical protein
VGEIKMLKQKIKFLSEGAKAGYIS